jgi:hypothetical protein|nr:MAG TPA: hypothetical protein [Bacteriophage sp.]
MNPINIIQMMTGGNPQQAIQSIIENNPNVQNNPLAQNAMKMYQNGDTRGLQNMAENMCKERGITVDQAKQQVMGMFNKH